MLRPAIVSSLLGGPCVHAIALVLAITAMAAKGQAGWTHAHGDAAGTQWAPGMGAMTGTGAGSPGVLWRMPTVDRTLDDGLFVDVDGDAVPELLMPYRGAAAAWSPLDGSMLWVSVPRSIDHIWPLADFDGDPTTTELLATSGATGGGAVLLDAASGGLLAELGPLPYRSGVDPAELAIFDLDGVGGADLILPASIFDLAEVQLASFSLGAPLADVATGAFPGYANMTPARAGNLLPGGERGFVLNQGHHYVIFAEAMPGDPDAYCAPSGAPCFRMETVIQSVHQQPTYFAPAFVIDTDGDGADELIEISSGPTAKRAVACLSFADALAEAVPTPLAVRRWYFDYQITPPGADATVVGGVSDPPVDLDGDGDLDLLINFHGNGATEVDRAGAPTDDGIDHALGASALVLDLGSGAPIASWLDRGAYGWVDLDADTVPEVVTASFTSGAWQEGLEGWELDCSTSACVPTLAWSSPGHRLEPQLEARLPRTLPFMDVHRLDHDGDGAPELLAWSGTTLDLLDVDGGGSVVVRASAATGGSAAIAQSDSTLGFVLMVEDGEATLLDAALNALGVHDVPAQGSSPFFVADGGATPLLISDGRAFPGGTTSGDVAADLGGTLTKLAFIEDLDEDGLLDILSFANAADGGGPGFSVRRQRWDDGTGSLQEEWTFASATVPELDGAVLGAALHMASGQFTGDATRDLFLWAPSASTWQFVVLDGATGAFDRRIVTTIPPASYTPMYVDDLVDDIGQRGADGIDDVVVRGSWETQVLGMAPTSTVHETFAPNFYHVLGAAADTDGDGEIELVSTLSATISNQIEVQDLSPAIAQAWGPQPLGLPSGSLRIFTLVDVQGDGALDPAYADGESAITIFDGPTGALLPGFPVRLVAGVLVPGAGAWGDVPSALIAFDVDGDGADELVAGSQEGWLYAIEVVEGAAATPSLLWSMPVGAAIDALGAGDMDGDGVSELLLSTDDGFHTVVGAVGSTLEILAPTGKETCLARAGVAVHGLATGITSVDLFISDRPGTQGIDATSGQWEGVVTALGPGVQLIRAEGKDALGAVVRQATVEVRLEPDDDGDGTSICAGDCDDFDPQRSPATDELCGDGIDQDCDGADTDCPPDPGDDDSADEPTPEQTPSPLEPPAGAEGCANIDCSMAREPQGGPLILVMAFALGPAVLRRRPRDGSRRATTSRRDGR